MTRSLTIGGFDPSLNNFGMAKAKFSRGQLEMVDLCLSEAPPNKNAKNVRKNSQDLERARKHVQAMKEFFHDVDLICVEIPVGSQNARAMVSYGVCIGILASLNRPLVQVTPAEVKEVVSKNASKKDIIEAMSQKYPQLPWLKDKKGLLNKNEHLADACASILSGVRTDQFQILAI